jgi:hypothetical protein
LINFKDSNGQSTGIILERDEDQQHLTIRILKKPVVADLLIDRAERRLATVSNVGI